MCHLKHDELCQSTTCPLNGYAASNAVFKKCEKTIFQDMTWRNNRTQKDQRQKNQDYFSDSTYYKFLELHMWGICNSTQSMKKYQIPPCSVFCPFLLTPVPDSPPTHSQTFCWINQISYVLMELIFKLSMVLLFLVYLIKQIHQKSYLTFGINPFEM